MTVTVVDPAPRVRRGLVDLLRRRGYPAAQAATGHEPGRELETSQAWVIVLRTPAEWALLERVAGVPSRPPVVGLLIDPTPQQHRQALQAGATCALPCDDAPALLVDAVGAALQGRTLLPVEDLRSLLEPEGSPDVALSDVELLVLRRLAEGAGMREIAEAAAYSERAAYRILKGIYQRLGVPGRAQALVQAARLGLLGHGDGPKQDR